MLPSRSRTEHWITVVRLDGVEPARHSVHSTSGAAPGDVIDLHVDPNDPWRVAENDPGARALTRWTSWMYRGGAALMAALMLGAVGLLGVIFVASWANGRMWQDGGTTLFLEDRELAKVDVEPAEMAGVEQVLLSHNQLTGLPTKLLVPTLVTLDLSWNQLASVPPELAHVPSLRVLRLSGNPLGATLPREVLALEGLVELRMEGVGLTELPVGIGDLTRLEILDLSQNELTGVPDSLCRLTHLKWLFLSGNPLAGLPPLEDLRGLERVSISPDLPDPELEARLEAYRVAHPEVEVIRSSF